MSRLILINTHIVRTYISSKQPHLYPILWPVIATVRMRGIQLWQQIGPMRPLVAETEKVVNIGPWYMVWPFKPNAVNRRINSECLWKGQSPPSSQDQNSIKFWQKVRQSSDMWLLSSDISNLFNQVSTLVHLSPFHSLCWYSLSCDLYTYQNFADQTS